jgi:hypothetical protein
MPTEYHRCLQKRVVAAENCIYNSGSPLFEGLNEAEAGLPHGSEVANR